MQCHDRSLHFARLLALVLGPRADDDVESREQCRAAETVGAPANLAPVLS